MQRPPYEIPEKIVTAWSGPVTFLFAPRRPVMEGEKRAYHPSRVELDGLIPGTVRSRVGGKSGTVPKRGAPDQRGPARGKAGVLKNFGKETQRVPSSSLAYFYSNR